MGCPDGRRGASSPGKKRVLPGADEETGTQGPRGCLLITAAARNCGWCGPSCHLHLPAVYMSGGRMSSHGDGDQGGWVGAKEASFLQLPLVGERVHTASRRRDDGTPRSHAGCMSTDALCLFRANVALARGRPKEGAACSCAGARAKIRRPGLLRRLPLRRATPAARVETW